ncbi:MAG: hypothetical protein QY312_00600 [Candidatus Dojkabacteria bacterium]|nr:MAG: hypothetical protein QY312_00600 [Candidatus Dojkabacteria bacterium]
MSHNHKEDPDHTIIFSTQGLTSRIEKRERELQRQADERKRRKAAIGSKAIKGCAIETGKLITAMIVGGVVGAMASGPGNEVIGTMAGVSAGAGLRSLYYSASLLLFGDRSGTRKSNVPTDYIGPGDDPNELDQVHEIQERKKKQGGHFGPKY